MQYVDALSRCNHILVIEGCTFNQALAIKQQTDPEIRSISGDLERSEHPLFELRNGLIEKITIGYYFTYRLACVTK